MRCGTSSGCSADERQARGPAHLPLYARATRCHRRRHGTAGGAPLADRLHACLREAWGLTDCVRLDLKIERYADDLTLLHPDTPLTENPTHAALDPAGHTVLVVDDVMY